MLQSAHVQVGGETLDSAPAPQPGQLEELGPVS